MGSTEVLEAQHDILVVCVSKGGFNESVDLGNIGFFGADQKLFKSESANSFRHEFLNSAEIVSVFIR